MPFSFIIPPGGISQQGGGAVTNRSIVVWDGTSGRFVTAFAGDTISANGAMTLAGAAVAANDPILAPSQTWNNAGVTFYGFDLLITNTASAAASRVMRVRVGATTVFDLNTAGGATLFGALTAGNAAVNAQSSFVGGTATASAPPLTITQTWNNAGVTFVGASIALTDSASAAASRPFQMTVGGADIAWFTKDGSLNTKFQSGHANSGAIRKSGTAGVWFGTFNQSLFMYAQNNTGDGSVVVRGDEGFYAFSDGSGTPGTPDVYIRRDAAAVLALYNTTNAQTMRIYRTRTNSTNYERLALQSGAGYFEVAAETAGTGTDDIDLRLTPSTTVAAVDFRNPVNGAGAGAGTITNAPSAGNPAYWLKIKIAGTTHYIPAWT